MLPSDWDSQRPWINIMKLVCFAATDYIHVIPGMYWMSQALSLAEVHYKIII